MKLKISKKSIIIASIIVALAGAGLIYYLSTKQSGDVKAWADSNWIYRKSLQVENTGSTVTNEDVLVTVDTATLVTNSKLQPDCDDLRFVDSDDSSYLDYWIEDGCNTASTKIWVRIPVLNSGGETIYMYYGNSSATSAQETWSGNVMMYADTTCPSGWTQASELNNKFLYGSSTYGSTGGSDTHSHSNAVCTSSTISTTSVAASSSTGAVGTTTTHTHESLTSAIASASILPSYKGAVLCYKNSFSIPTGLISLFKSSLPTDWSSFSGLDNVFPRVGATYGSTGGSNTHTHTTTTGTATNTSTNTSNTLTLPFSGTGGTITTSGSDTIHKFTSSGTFTANKAGSVKVLVVGGGGGGGMDMGGGGGGGGVIYNSNFSVSAQSYSVTVGAGGAGAPAAGTNGQPSGHQYTISAQNGGNSIFSTLTAIGGGRGGSSFNNYTPGAAGASGGSGGGASGYTSDNWTYCAAENGTCSFTGTWTVRYGAGSSWAYKYGVAGSIGCNNSTFGDPIPGTVKACYYQTFNSVLGGSGTSGQGYAGGNQGYQYYSGGGGGAGGVGASGNNQANGGAGYYSDILGTGYYWGGGGGGAGYSICGGNGGVGGGGGGAVCSTTGGAGLNNGSAGGGGSVNSQTNTPGGNGGANTGGGGGGGSHYNSNNKGGDGGSGIVIIRYATPAATSGTVATSTHTHTTNSATVDSGTNTPPYLTMIFGKANTNTYVSSDNILITSSVPPLGYNRFAELDNKFVIGSSTYGTTGGSDSHTHTVTNNTGAPSATMTAYGSGISLSDSTHTHSCSVSSDSVSNLPAYSSVIYMQRKVSKVATIGLEEMDNAVPNTPSSLLTEGLTNPTCITDLTPEFSAVYSDTEGDTGDYYEIQVNTSSDFTGTSMWDSTKTAFGTPIINGNRSSDISYAGTTLSYGTVYYWRIKFFDAGPLGSSWSSTAQFVVNYIPNQPSSLLTEGQTNPTKTTLSPYFSAIFSDNDTSDTATYYQILVNSSSDFIGTIMWDSTKTSFSTPITNGNRSPDISYAGTTLESGTTYFWKIKFWDNNDLEGTYSDTATFTTTGVPSAPTDLLTNGQTNPTIVNDYTPYFSAIYSDINGDNATYYEIEINTNSSFTGTVIWDTDKTSTNITSGSRSPNYESASLGNIETTYYWRIRFWDTDDNVSEWSSTASFTTSSTHFRFEGLKMEGIKLN